MVRQDSFKGREAYVCEECDMHYENREDAEKCEKHCREENACSLEITRKSLERQLE